MADTHHAEPRREANSAYARPPQAFSYPDMSAGEAAVQCFKDYARERPEIVTMWAFGLGFVLGWKLRIW